MATHNDLVSEGNRIGDSLDFMNRIISDKSTIPEQRNLVKLNASGKQARLTVIRAALDRDCDGCGHPKGGHVSGMGQCLNNIKTDRCGCHEWTVNDG